MSKHPSVSAALKRLTEWSRWQQHDHGRDPIDRSELDNPYAREKGHSQPADVEVVCAALRLVDECASYVDAEDGQPFYTVNLPCSWQTADKGFLACLTASRGRGRDDVG